MAKKAGVSALDVGAGFVKGFVDGARDVGESGVTTPADTARVIGDIAGALVPGLGEIKAIQDVWEGVKRGDTTLLIGGLIGLIPVAGAFGKVGVKGAKKLGAAVAQKGVKNASLHLSERIAKTATKTLRSAKTKQRLTEAAEIAGQAAVMRLVNKLQEMMSAKQKPDVETRTHEEFIGARVAAFKGMGEKPDGTWADLINEADGKKEVVGRISEDGEHGFRFFAPVPGDETNTLRFYWWKDNADGKTPTFGLEECPADKDAVSRILDAYLNRDRSFRIKRS